MKTGETTFGVIWGVIVRLAIIAAVLYFLYKVRSILVTVLLSIMFAYAVIPMVNLMCRLRIVGCGPKWKRLWATLIAFVILAAAVGLMLHVFLIPFGQELRNLSSNLGSYWDQTVTFLRKTISWYAKLPPDLQDFLAKQDVGRLGATFARWVNSVAQSTLNWLRHILEVVLIPVLAFYLIVDSRSLKHEFLALAPRSRVREALVLSREVSAILQSYVIGQFILCLIAAVVVGVGLGILGVQYALVLAVLAGVTRAIPIIGPIIGGIPIVLLATLQSTTLGLYVLAFFTILHLVESKLIMPKLIGDRMRLHPAVVIVALLVGGEFFGILGMFLAAPVTAIIREFVRFYLIGPRYAGMKAPHAKPRAAEHEAAV